MQERQQAPHARPEIARIVVHRVGDRLKAGRGNGGGKPAPRQVEERPRDRDAGRPDRRAHRGEPEDAGAADEAHQEGLGEIVPVVGEKEMAGARLTRRLDQQAVARRARGGLDVASSAWPFPVKGPRLHAQAAGEASDLPCLRSPIRGAGDGRR